MRKLLQIALCAALMIVASSTLYGASLTLTQIQQIARSGTPGLALTLLDEQHPGTEQGFDEWFRWSKARIGILTQWRSWERAGHKGTGRRHRPPPGIPG